MSYSEQRQLNLGYKYEHIYNQAANYGHLLPKLLLLSLSQKDGMQQQIYLHWKKYRVDQINQGHSF